MIWTVYFNSYPPVVVYAKSFDEARRQALRISKMPSRDLRACQPRAERA